MNSPPLDKPLVKVVAKTPAKHFVLSGAISAVVSAAVVAGSIAIGHHPANVPPVAALAAVHDTPAIRTYPTLTDAQEIALHDAILADNAAGGIKHIYLVCIDPACQPLAKTIAEAITRTDGVEANSVNSLPAVDFDFPLTTLPPGISIVANAALATRISIDLSTAAGGDLPIRPLVDSKKPAGVIVIAFGRKV